MGKYKGTSVLQDEQNRGLAMIRALSDAQRAKAILTSSKTGNLNLTEAWKDNVVLDYAGLRVAEMTDAQRKQLVDLIALYVDNMDDGHARVKMDEVRRHLDQTWFAWMARRTMARSSTTGFTVAGSVRATITSSGPMPSRSRTRSSSIPQ